MTMLREEALVKTLTGSGSGTAGYGCSALLDVDRCFGAVTKTGLQLVRRSISSQASILG